MLLARAMHGDITMIDRCNPLSLLIFVAFLATPADIDNTVVEHYGAHPMISLVQVLTVQYLIRPRCCCCSSSSVSLHQSTLPHDVFHNRMRFDEPSRPLHNIRFIIVLLLRTMTLTMNYSSFLVVRLRGRCIVVAVSRDIIDYDCVLVLLSLLLLLRSSSSVSSHDSNEFSTIPRRKRLLRTIPVHGENETTILATFFQRGIRPHVSPARAFLLLRGGRLSSLSSSSFQPRSIALAKFRDLDERVFGGGGYFHLGAMGALAEGECSMRVPVPLSSIVRSLFVVGNCQCGIVVLTMVSFCHGDEPHSLFHSLVKFVFSRRWPSRLWRMLVFFFDALVFFCRWHLFLWRWNGNTMFTMVHGIIPVIHLRQHHRMIRFHRLLLLLLQRCR
mmetsp:Transcript_6376/g.13875  ORF Transcript_6376/g.13875 Transcript_6376/m.13875 type:complete len:387 (-) Transcript_6376:889-2049(-)